MPAPLLVVIGGSRGIGAAVVRRAVRDGYRVAFSYHSALESARNLVAELQVCGGEVQAYPVEAADAQSIEEFFSIIERDYGIPSGLVYCAGIAGRTFKLIGLSPSEISSVISTNLLGAFYAVQSASRRMVKSNGGVGGSIVLISSEAGKFGGNRLTPYAASKAGLNALVVGAARELAPEGVRLNGVSPGIIETDQFAGLKVEQYQSLVKSIPLGRMGKPGEVANAVLWLLSEESTYVTGTILSIAGGR